MKKTTANPMKVGKYVMNAHHLRIYQRCASCTQAAMYDQHQHICKVKSAFVRTGNALGNCPTWDMREQLAALGMEQGQIKTPEYMAFLKGWRRAESHMAEKLRRARYEEIEAAYNESCSHCLSEERRNIYYQAWGRAEETMTGIESVAKPMRALMRADFLQIRDAFAKMVGQPIFMEV